MHSSDQFLKTLDISVFEGIPSQTSDDDRKSLLALQAAARSKRKTYTYLEIGSFLGGSLQPHLLDSSCERIYSIDKRCAVAPDDRDQTSTITYEDNTSEKMLSLLRAVDEASLPKIVCFEADAADIALEKISVPPDLAFIDGEHTYAAVLADFEFCSRVVAPDGCIAFHDSYIIYPALEKICKDLKRNGRDFRFWKLGGAVTVVSFDAQFAARVPQIESLVSKNRRDWSRFCARQQAKKVLPRPVFQMLKRAFSPQSQTH
jgi:predicted O-methyltransferase YrrM